MNNFLKLSKFIYNFENYYKSFAYERKLLKIIFRAFINNDFNKDFENNFNNNTKNNYVKYILLLYYTAYNPLVYLMKIYSSISLLY